MVSLMIKYKNIFLIATVLFFVGSLGFVGAGVFMEEYGPNAAVAYVGKTKIKVKDFENSYRMAERNLRERGQEITDETPKQLRQEVLQQMITQESMAQSAEKFGLGAADIEIGYDIKSNFSSEGLFNKTAYTWVVRNQFNMTPAQYEDMLRRQKLADKFQNLLILSAKVTPQEAAFMLHKPEPAKKGAKPEQQPDPETAAIMLMQMKAQSLADGYTRQFNERERVELKNQDRLGF